MAAVSSDSPARVSITPSAMVYRRNLNLKAKSATRSLHISCKRLVSGAFNLGLIGSTCTALPWCAWTPGTAGPPRRPPEHRERCESQDREEDTPVHYEQTVRERVAWPCLETGNGAKIRTGFHCSHGLHFAGKVTREQVREENATALMACSYAGQGTRGQVREEDAASVHGYTGTP